MTYTPHDGDGWQGTTGGEPSPRDGLPATQPGDQGTSRLLLYVAVGCVAALAAVAVVMLVSSGGDEGSGDSGSAAGGALATATTSTMPPNQGTMAPSTTEAAEPDTDGGSSAGADLPPVTIPAESSPPTTIPGSEPNSIPTDIMSGEEAPEWGTLVVDLEEGGYLDFPVHLRTDQELSMLSLADDGIQTEIEVFAPDGSSEGSWQGGEPGVVNGWEWYPPDDSLPATGTYVIRVIHTGGSHEPFAIGFFGNE
jgi:hypothetical protein